ncbi:wd-40 repeat protein [Stylonychia lemnae]|uniref:Wd-40 repeat protein n=1 Tax=Stylonychia lemnae TaxID=5949 RepID=A0A078ALK4_STYLE|nr:wd-40 repeat protein [Stylonychia lemnae]|eukprot:CDW83104.1 wd-40 repeat protein [Stylonychia lemnae]
MLEGKGSQVQAPLDPNNNSTKTQANQNQQIINNPNKELYQKYINLNEASICEEGVFKVSSVYHNSLSIEGVRLVKNQTQIFINGVTEQRSTGDQVSYCQLRDINTYEEIKLKVLDVEYHYLEAQNKFRNLNEFNVSPCGEYLLYNIQLSRQVRQQIHVCIHKIDDFFDNKPPIIKIGKDLFDGRFKNILFGSLNQVIFTQQLDSNSQTPWELKSLVIFKCNYTNPKSLETEVYDLQNWFKDVPKRGNVGDKPMKYISSDGVFRSFIGYPEFELSDFFIDKFLFATYKQTRTLVFDQQTLNIIFDLDHLIYFSQDTEYLGYDRQFNIFQVTKPNFGNIEKIGQLIPPEQWVYDSKKPHVTNISIIMNAQGKIKKKGAVLVYDKLRFNLINKFTLKEIYEEKNTAIYYHQGLLKYFNNDNKKFLKINLYNSKYEQEDSNIYQHSDLYKSDDSCYVYNWNKISQVYDLEQQRVSGTLPAYLQPKMFMKLGTQYYLAQIDASSLYLIRQNDTRIIQKVGIEGGKYGNELQQVISMSDQEVQILGLSDNSIIQILHINLLEFTAQIQQLKVFEGKYKKTLRVDQKDIYQIFKNEQSNQILIVVVVQKVLYIYDFNQKILNEYKGDFLFISLTISWKDNALIGLVNQNMIKAFEINTGQLLPNLCYTSKNKITNIKVVQDYLLLYLSGDINAFELIEIKNSCFTQQRVQFPLYPLEDFCQYPRNYQMITSQSDRSIQYQLCSTDEKEDVQKTTLVRKIDPLKLFQTNNSRNLDYPLIQLTHLPTAKFVLLDKNNGMSFYHDERDKRIGFVSTYFITDEIVKIKEAKVMNNDNLLTELNDISSYLKYYPGIGNILNEVALRPIILEFLAKKLSLMDKSETPIVIMRNEINGKSPIDVACDKNQIKSLTIFLELLTKYQNDHGFNYLMDDKLIYFIKKGLDLSEYFDSLLPKLSIISENYPTEHEDENEYIQSVNNLERPSDINQKYEEIFGQILEINKSEGLASIEYYLINLPSTLTINPKNLMKTLSETEKIEYFENLTIQTIIKFKWNHYTKNFFQNQFLIFLIFVVSFVFEIYYSISSGKTQAQPSKEDLLKGMEINEDTRNLATMIVNKCICTIVLLYFFYYEVRQARKQVGYFKELWNLSDFSLIASYFILNIIEFTSDDRNALVIMQIIVVLFSFLKINFFLRIYDGFSFLVSMMGGVFKDIYYFILFFVIFILQFGLIFIILFSAQYLEEYDGIGTFGYFLMIFRISSGDFAVDNYKNQGSTLMITLSWTIWVIAVLILNIVFMNFIIAVISESYEKVMQKLVAQSYKVKANMIVERELLLNPMDEDERNFYYPQYIILRRSIETLDGESGEWQGFIKDLKYTIRTSALKSKAEVIQNVVPIQNKIEALEKYSISQQEMMSNLRAEIGDQKMLIQLLQKSVQDQNLKNETSAQKQDINNLNSKLETLSIKMQGCETALQLLNANMLKLLEK